MDSCIHAEGSAGLGGIVPALVDEARQNAIIEQLTAHARNFLVGAKTEYPDGFDVGDFGIVFDLHFTDGTSGIGYACSDGREWVHAGLFRAAMLSADDGGGTSSDEPRFADP